MVSLLEVLSQFLLCEILFVCRGMHSHIYTLVYFHIIPVFIACRLVVELMPTKSDIMLNLGLMKVVRITASVNLFFILVQKFGF